MEESVKNRFGAPTPVFRVGDVDASITYYLGALGFDLRRRASTGFACVARENCSIFLTSGSRFISNRSCISGIQQIRRRLSPGDWNINTRKA